MIWRVRLFELVLVTAALVVPLAVVAVAGLARWRIRREMPRRSAVARSVAEMGMLVGTLPWLAMGLWPIDAPPGTTHWQLSPFADITRQLSGPASEAFTQIVANLLVFAALGMFAPVRFASLSRPLRLLVLGAVASLALEVSQQLFGTGRVFSVDDIMLNALGCLLGGLVSHRWWTVGAGSPIPGSDRWPSTLAGVDGHDRVHGQI